jgi:phospholipid/cholesterol/gamma-HCH transport system substrate-binding protein
MEARFKLRRVNEIAGVFVLVVLGLLIALVLWTGRSQRWFKGKVSLRITFPEAGAAGIRQGSEVYFLGTLVGSVSDVIVDSTGRMEAEARIRRDFFRFIRADSSAMVKRQFGVAGDSFFEITRGEGQSLPEKDASIICNEQFQSVLEAAVEEVRREALLVLNKVNTGLETWTRLGAELGETRQHVDQLAVRLENLVAGTQAGQGTVGRLMTDSTLVDDAQILLAQAKATTGELRAAVTNLQRTINHVQAGTMRLPEITEAVANEARDLTGLVQQSQISMREVERLIQAMQRHWLLRKYVNLTNPPSLRVPSVWPAPETKPTKKLRSPKDPRGQ